MSCFASISDDSIIGIKKSFENLHIGNIDVDVLNLDVSGGVKNALQYLDTEQNTPFFLYHTYMHRLAFGDFHSKHFGPEKKAYWQSILKQQQQQQQQQQQYHQHQYQQQFYECSQYETEEQQEEEQDEQEQEEQYYPEYEELSKEAIEIFQFSEAYRKEKELEQMNREKDDTEGMQDWQYDESTVLCSGGIEAPATSLVLTQPKSSNDKIRVQEDLLNSAYLNSCRNVNKQEPVILWPVLPFKM